MTFKEFFDKIGLNNVDENLSTIFDGFSYILDLPKSTFDVIKGDYIENFKQQINSENLNKVLNTQEGMEIALEDLEEGIETLLNIIDEGVEEYKEELDPERLEFFELLIAALVDAFNNIPKRRQVEVGIELIRDNAKYPTYAHNTDAGADVYAVQDEVIMPGETKIIPTGFKVQVPDGFELQARPRSGMSAKTKIRLSNAPGTIDPGYDGEVGVILDNIGNTPYEIKTGDRVCQLLIKPCPMIIWKDVKVKQDRNGGFGSTGK